MGLDERTKRVDFSESQLKLIRRSVARRCTLDEFDEFMAIAAQCGLDPLRRQITPLILNADDPDRRRLIPWTTIDGLRVIAARNHDYRPMEEAPTIEYDAALTDEAKNPLGIVRAEVRTWKLADGVWHAVVGEAWWDEFAPLCRAKRASPGAYEGSDAEQTVIGAATAVEFELDGAWRRMGRVMISKCAESQALRRGWPDLLAGLYSEEELSGAKLADRTASEVLAAAHEERARERKNSRTLWFTPAAGASFEPVLAGDVEGYVSNIYRSAQLAAEIVRFDHDNRASLASYWEWMPAQALRLKSMSEAFRSTLLCSGGSSTASKHHQNGTGPSACVPTLVGGAHGQG